MTSGPARSRGRVDDLSAADDPVRRLLERMAAPAAAAVPDLVAIGAALLEFAADLDYVRPWIRRLGERSGSLPMHAPERGPRLGLVHRLDGQLSALHDHGTWVAISPVAGRDAHRRFAVDRRGSTPTVSLADEQPLVPGDIVTLLPPDDAHDHGHQAGHGAPAHVLILTGDDQRAFVRNEWDLATGRHRVLRPGDPARWLASEAMPSE